MLKATYLFSGLGESTCLKPPATSSGDSGEWVAGVQLLPVVNAPVVRTLTCKN